MDLDFVRRTYERLGEDDPFYAVLTIKQFRHNRWDREEFFQTGKREIEEVMRIVSELGIELRRQRALDFGCGVGRLTQALGDYFQEVVGVDIANSMVQHARRLNRHGDRVQYLVNTTDDLSILSGDNFDFIYSFITLQHVPPDGARNYIREFVRLLRPGGVAMFQVPSGKAFPPGSWSSWLYRLRRQHLRHLWKMLRGQPPVEVHYVARSDVEQLVRDAGGTVLNVSDILIRGKPRQNFRYCVTK